MTRKSLCRGAATDRRVQKSQSSAIQRLWTINKWNSKIFAVQIEDIRRVKVVTESSNEIRRVRRQQNRQMRVIKSIENIEDMNHQAMEDGKICKNNRARRNLQDIRTCNQDQSNKMRTGINQEQSSKMRTGIEDMRTIKQSGGNQDSQQIKNNTISWMKK